LQNGFHFTFSELNKTKHPQPGWWYALRPEGINSGGTARPLNGQSHSLHDPPLKRPMDLRAAFPQSRFHPLFDPCSEQCFAIIIFLSKQGLTSGESLL